MRSNKGFTLIEMMLVIALVVIMGTAVSVQFTRAFASRSKEHFVRDLSSYLRYVQFRSIEKAAAHKLRVEDNGKVLAAYVLGSGNRFEAVKDRVLKHFEEKTRFELDFEDGDEIYFFPDGTVTRNTLHVLLQDDKVASLAVKNRLGMIEVKTYGA